jgi:hypothetical protein
LRAIIPTTFINLLHVCPCSFFFMWPHFTKQFWIVDWVTCCHAKTIVSGTQDVELELNPFPCIHQTYSPLH